MCALLLQNFTSHLRNTWSRCPPTLGTWVSELPNSTWNGAEIYWRILCVAYKTNSAVFWYFLFNQLHAAQPLDKLTVTQLLKKVPGVYATRRLITVFTTISLWTLSWSRRIQSKPSHAVPLRSILILSSHLRVGAKIVSSLQVLRLHFVWIYHSSHACYMPYPSHPPWFDHPNSNEHKVKVALGEVCSC